MAAQDFAILVGISRYADPSFPELDGPMHDVELMREWLMSDTGGDVPEARIKTIVSPPTFPANQDPQYAPPRPEQFDDIFLEMEHERMALKGARVNSRLYLYFSGHGFSSREMSRGAEAALYAANACRRLYRHIYGTYFARRAEGKALFKEIVLIMDCCRDAEANRVPTAPPLVNTPDEDLAADVKVLSIYAVPHGGKAHERAIAERDGKVYGLLTHALVKTFEEARPSDRGQISATRLRDHLKQCWESICGGDGVQPPSPRVYPPTDEIFFAAKNMGVGLKFSFGVPHPTGTKIVIRDGTLQMIAQFSATGAAKDDLVGAESPILHYDRTGTSLDLRVLPGFYHYEVTGAGGKTDTLKIETGHVHVDL